MAAALVMGIINGNAGEVAGACLEGAGAAVRTMLSVAGVMCLWSGLLKVAEKGGAVRLFSAAVSPAVKRLFPNVAPDSEAFRCIVLNITANLLGVGNAATPMGLKAVREMDRLDSDDTADSSLCRFVLINTASIQLIPSTVIALRAGAGSADPGGVILPVWITSAAALAAGLAMLALTEKLP